MKKILFIGSKDKTDLTMYLAQIFTQLNLKTMIIDTTLKQKYQKAYTNLKDKGLYNFSDVDILCGASSFNEASEITRNNDEDISSYEMLLVDVDEKTYVKDWPIFDHVIYVGDYERLTMVEDSELLLAFLDEYGDQRNFIRISHHIDSDIREDYFNELINHSVTWSDKHFLIELDERNLENKICMQYTMMATFKKLTRPYKNLLKQLVTAILGFHEKDTRSAMKRRERSLNQ